MSWRVKRRCHRNGIPYDRGRCSLICQSDDDDEAYAPSLYLEDKSSNFAAELESENFEEQATES